MNNTLYKKKLQIVSDLFTNPLYDKDYDELDKKDYNLCLMTTDILKEAYTPTKDNLKYINDVVSKLISILLLDASKITQKYVSSRLYTKDGFSVTRKDGKVPFRPDETWIENYKKLIKLIKK